MGFEGRVPTEQAHVEGFAVVPRKGRLERVAHDVYASLSVTVSSVRPRKKGAHDGPWSLEATHPE